MVLSSSSLFAFLTEKIANAKKAGRSTQIEGLEHYVVQKPKLLLYVPLSDDITYEALEKRLKEGELLGKKYVTNMQLKIKENYAVLELLNEVARETVRNSLRPLESSTDIPLTMVKMVVGNYYYRYSRAELITQIRDNNSLDLDQFRLLKLYDRSEPFSFILSVRTEVADRLIKDDLRLGLYQMPVTYHYPVAICMKCAG